VSGACHLFAAFLLVAGAAGLVQAPARLELRIDPSGGGQAILANLTTVPLTAFVLQIFLEPCNPFPRPDVYRVVDTAQTPGEAPLMPRQVHVEPLGVAHCNKVGNSVPGRAELKAAVFQNGTSFGEQSWVDAVLESRKAQLDQLEIVLSRLKARGAATEPGQVLLADLQTALTSSSKNSLPFPSPSNVGELVQKNLEGPDSSLPDRIAHTIILFEQLRNTLLDARPALR
jgi:hypothetical protein